MNETICDLLETLPTGYPLQAIIVDGNRLEVTRFVNIDAETDLAYFIQANGGLVVADCMRISSVDFF